MAMSSVNDFRTVFRLKWHALFPCGAWRRKPPSIRMILVGLRLHLLEGWSKAKRS
jgi:hypothetical protein